MAIVKGQWLERKDRQSRIKRVKDEAAKLAKRIKKGDYDEVDTQTFTSLDGEVKRLEAINKGEHDTAFFAYRYFSDQFNPDNSAGNIIRDSEDGEPHESLAEIAPIHRDFYDICDDMAKSKKGKNYVIASPRGHSKTSIISVINSLHSLVYRGRRSPYILIISETDSLSKKIVSAIANQLKYNERLREDFGELLHVQSLKNKKDSDEGFITTTNSLVEASSAGKSLRGKTHNNHRPTNIILDDISSANNEATENLRDKLIEWFNSVITPLGSRSTDIVFVGTLVSATGLLAHLLKRRDFTRVFHQAILNHADNQQLWQDYIHLYTTEDDFTVVENFYREHEAEMNEGVELAWPARWTYRELMHTKVNIGSKSFASELMNESFAQDEQVFNVDAYEFYRKSFAGSTPHVVYNDEFIPYSRLEITGAWDVAMGANARSDYNAFVTIGRDRETGRIFVLDVYATKEQPSIFMEKILDRIVEYKHRTVVVEGIGAYWEFFRQLSEKARMARIYSTRIKDIKSHGRKSKESRIEMLEPIFANQTLILNDQHSILTQQLRHYPHGGKVDAIDALSMAVESGGKRKRIVMREKPAWL